ncbi:Carboxylic acid transporter [Elasticomyces elasticus]|nr:Carboxylic acid transporter [Elasticomyces elasticus]KAK3655252.1 Carboxylic acid transporter [Elasticomyces elasticus]KAK4913531.1 Carboxylic acid transporter [Elasticomyces elasticus]KAK5767268.1 Carboxylic acid transporter [Elasticomyces elasticus]
MAFDKDPNYVEQRDEAGYAPARPTEENMSAGRYLATRLSTLKPPMDKVDNPFSLLASLTLMNWLMFLCAFLAWTWDAFDFFTVSLVVSDLAEDFGKTTKDITWGITLVLMFRSVGAVLFGIAADRYGRRWPFVVNNLLFIVLELGTGFCQTYKQFLACRALFGVAMGGIYGNCAATAIEDVPEKARGIVSGMLQQGYAFGYLLATAFARGLVDTTKHGWRPLFWFGACPPILFIAFRLCLPETDSFIERQRVRAAGHNVGKTFISEGRVALKRHWMLLIYLVLLMAGFNFMSHGSQDLYPTMLTNQYNFSKNAVTVTQVVANLGAMTGGTVVGYLSQMFGRRFSIIVISILGGALLYPYGFTGSKAVIAAAFFEQFCVQGAWGVIPIHLMELSPGSFRTFVVGTSYQLGNLVSSASSTIEATIGERFPLPSKIEGGKTILRYRYGIVISIFVRIILCLIAVRVSPSKGRWTRPMCLKAGQDLQQALSNNSQMGCVFAYVIVLTFLGPEYKGKDMGVANDADLEEAAGHDAIEAAAFKPEGRRNGSTDDIEKV